MPRIGSSSHGESRLRMLRIVRHRFVGEVDLLVDLPRERELFLQIRIGDGLALVLLVVGLVSRRRTV